MSRAEGKETESVKVELEKKGQGEKAGTAIVVLEGFASYQHGRAFTPGLYFLPEVQMKPQCVSRGCLLLTYESFQIEAHTGTEHHLQLAIQGNPVGESVLHSYSVVIAGTAPLTYFRMVATVRRQQ